MLGNSVSPAFSFRPVSYTLLDAVNSKWGEVFSSMPEDVPEDVEMLLQDAQGHLNNAVSLSNPVYSAGELYKALGLLEQAYALL
jgi:hypothetical protein